MLLHYKIFNKISSYIFGSVTTGYGFMFFKKRNVENKQDAIIIQADKLFNEENYLEVYKLLDQYKDTKNVEIQWRICRVLYKLTRKNNYDELKKCSLLNEAYGRMHDCLQYNTENAQVHKWLAIVLDAKLPCENIFVRINDNLRAKDYLLEAHRLDPNDYSVIYMLGQWHYKMSNMTWLQKKMATYLYRNFTISKYEDALSFFLKAEDIKPRYYVSNIYMLGKINYQLGNMYRAHYYLNIAAKMTPHTDLEEDCIVKANKLVKKLKAYDYLLYWYDL